jgi:hypothetical protein
MSFKTRSTRTRLGRVAALATAGALALSTGLLLMGAGAAQAGNDNGRQPPRIQGDATVAFCHATGNDDKYVYLELPVAGVFSGHLVWSEGGEWQVHQDGDDIIPSFPYQQDDGSGWADRTFPGQHTELAGWIHPEDGGWCGPGTTPPTSVSYLPPLVTAPTCERDGYLTRRTQPAGVTEAVSPEGTGPGTYTFTYTLAEGYAWGDGTTGAKTVTVTVLGELPDQSADPQGACYVPPPRTEVTPGVTFTEATCEVQDGAGVVYAHEDRVVYTVTEGSVAEGAGVVVTASPRDGYVFPSGATTTWSHTFVDLESLDCGGPTPPPPTPKPPKPPKPPVDVCLNLPGVQTAVPAGMTLDGSRGCVRPQAKPTQTHRPRPTHTPVPPGQPPQVGPGAGGVPTVVDAGLAGPVDSGTATGTLGRALAGAGVLMLAAAGVIVLPRPQRGSHQM